MMRFAMLNSLCSAGDIETKQATSTYTLGTAVDHQQVGAVWSAPTTVVSLAMSGDLNVFDTRAGDKPAKILYVRQTTPDSRIGILI